MSLKRIEIALTSGERGFARIVRPWGFCGGAAINTTGETIIEFVLEWGCFPYRLDTILELESPTIVLHAGYAEQSRVSSTSMLAVRDLIITEINNNKETAE